MIPAIRSRRFSWRLMIAAMCVALLISPLSYGLKGFPWISLLLTLTAVVLLHPLMDKDDPMMIGADVVRSPRTYVALALFITAMWLAYPYQKAFSDCWRSGLWPNCGSK